jgi:hypothetical protein
MEEVGEVVEILTSKHVLIKALRDVAPSTVVHVAARIENPEITQKYALPALTFPKGELRILNSQGQSLYLAEVFSEDIERNVMRSPADNILSGFFKAEKETVKGAPSAKLDASTIKIAASTLVQVGDRVLL